MRNLKALPLFLLLICPMTLTLLPSVMAQCSLNCLDRIGQRKPVCGSDDVTYFNMEELLCQKKCNPDLRFRHNGICRSLWS
ncbi:unnamed protein product [Allacma fusca]|uniref:Kazal-like domain-containing protein n=1 Tax=Allacma fusca TaxID=39272 RepID=A0A8J2K4J2_9HEXA|nr:unnamed protein product [Allacma fusca]